MNKYINVVGSHLLGEKEMQMQSKGKRGGAL
jgi:hypothetical protein